MSDNLKPGESIPHATAEDIAEYREIKRWHLVHGETLPGKVDRLRSEIHGNGDIGIQMELRDTRAAVEELGGKVETFERAMRRALWAGALLIGQMAWEGIQFLARTGLLEGG